MFNTKVYGIILTRCRQTDRDLTQPACSLNENWPGRHQRAGGLSSQGAYCPHALYATKGV